MSETETEATPDAAAVLVPLSEIQTDRRASGRLKPPMVADLVESIRKIGLTQPVVITRGPLPGRMLGPGQVYYLLAGHRRYGAFQALDAEEPGGPYASIPAREVDAATELAAITVRATENLQRHALHWTEEAAELYNLKTIGQLSDTEVAAVAGRTRTWAANLLAIRNGLIPGWWDRAVRADGTCSQADAARLCRQPAAVQQEELEALLGTGKKRGPAKPVPGTPGRRDRRPSRAEILEFVAEVDAGLYASRTPEWRTASRDLAAWAGGLEGAERPAVDDHPEPERVTARPKSKRSPKRRK